MQLNLSTAPKSIHNIDSRALLVGVDMEPYYYIFPRFDVMMTPWPS
jgi:hypothetical protein